MSTRRMFLKAAAVAGLARTALPATAADPPLPPAPESDRHTWLRLAEKIARPVLENLAAGTLRQNMPVESSGKNREQFSHLEAFGRLLCGIAPWLAAKVDDAPEAALQQDLHTLTLRALDRATDPTSPDFLNFSTGGGQPLVDTAFLALALLRAKETLFTPLDPRVQQQLLAALKSSRAIEAPAKNNWVLFAATVEAALLDLGETSIPARLQTELQRMLDWYLGDGIYGDGPEFHADAYNAFVIHPMLVDCLACLACHDARFIPSHTEVLRRAQRYAQIQERWIAPEGSFPVVGRSVTYRCGAFHALAQIALLEKLPAHLPPAQVRCALTAVVRRTMDAPDTFDDHGFLRIGLCGHQPALGETYISTGSLYLCAAVLLPLGLSAENPFWHDPPHTWTSQCAWTGQNLIADHALERTPPLKLPDVSPP